MILFSPMHSGAFCCSGVKGSWGRAWCIQRREHKSRCWTLKRTIDIMLFLVRQIAHKVECHVHQIVICIIPFVVFSLCFTYLEEPWTRRKRTLRGEASGACFLPSRRRGSTQVVSSASRGQTRSVAKADKKKEQHAARKQQAEQQGRWERRSNEFNSEDEKIRKYC